MSSRAVLVTGGAGYIGSHACKALALAGYLPVTLDNLGHGHREAVRWGPLVEGDIQDRALVEKTIAEHRIGAVMHFAAHASVGESMHAPGKYFANNVSGSLRLVDAALACGVTLMVFSSSCATYGMPQVERIGEDDVQDPVNPYGASKLFVERALHWYGVAYDMRSVSLRYFNAAGADADLEAGEQHDPETHLIPLAIDAALGKRGPLQVYGVDYPTPDGTAVRDYVHVSDLADGHVRALEYLRARGKTAAFNLGTGTGYSVLEVVEAIQRVGGRPVPRQDAPRRAGDPVSLIAAPGRASELLAWTPQRSSLDNIISSAWRWHAR